jgi:hypothetical protein
MAVSQSSGRQRQVTGLVAPAKWVCPSCGAKVQTFVPTYVPECRSQRHRGKMVLFTTGVNDEA